MKANASISSYIYIYVCNLRSQIHQKKTSDHIIMIMIPPWSKGTPPHVWRRIKRGKLFFFFLYRGGHKAQGVSFLDSVYVRAFIFLYVIKNQTYKIKIYGCIKKGSIMKFRNWFSRHNLHTESMNLKNLKWAAFTGGKWIKFQAVCKHVVVIMNILMFIDPKKWI